MTRAPAVRALGASALAAWALGTAAGVLARPPGNAAGETVTLVVHVVLSVPQALRPAPDSYCLGERRPFRSTAIPGATPAALPGRA